MPEPAVDMQVFEPRTGDLPAMLERRLIRVLVPWSDNYYYLDGAIQKGIAYEAAKSLGTWLNKEMATGAAYALALRKDSPEFKALLNRFIKQHKRGTLAGNMVVNRYLHDTSRLQRIDSEEDLERMLAVRDYFRWPTGSRTRTSPHPEEREPRSTVTVRPRAAGCGGCAVPA